MSKPDEIISSRETFFAPASLEINPIFCGDERAPDTDETYIHIFGGVLNTAFNLNVMQEIAQPGSVTHSFEATTSKVVPQVIEIAHALPGVHSDDHAEQGETFRLDTLEGAVGCGYAGLRKEISQTIVDKATPIIRRAVDLQPELFSGAADAAFADKVIHAHASLINRAKFLTTGRRVVLAAINQGARTMLVHGQHVGKSGIINLEPNTSLRSGEALRAGLPAYDHDAWATAEINNRLHDIYPYDIRQQQIAELIDTLGTFMALGVALDAIVVRRLATVA